VLTHPLHRDECRQQRRREDGVGDVLGCQHCRQLVGHRRADQDQSGPA